ncbi:ABC transporter family protein [Paraburkholderia sp. BL23I1N1]|nr:ABC transporter family protein [Paraburkholderia sp. BL23I1N1]
MDSTDHDALSAVLSVSGIGKTYAEPVLADVSQSLRAGEVLALTGENGAGKSTLSKIIGGLVGPTTGTMRLGGTAYAPASRTGTETLLHATGTHEAGSLS